MENSILESNLFFIFIRFHIDFYLFYCFVILKENLKDFKEIYKNIQGIDGLIPVILTTRRRYGMVLQVGWRL